MIRNFDNGKIRNAEEIRIRSLIYLRTHEKSLIKNIDNSFAYAGLYPQKIQLLDGKIVDEMTTMEFFQYCDKFPDIKEVLIKHNLWSDIYERKLKEVNNKTGILE